MANYTKVIAYNTFIQIIGKIITTAISVVMLAYLARYLGVSRYGDYTTVFAFLGFFAIIADMGLFTVAVRDIAKNPEKAPYIMGNIFTVRILFAVFFLILAPAIGYLIPVYSSIIKTSILIGSFFSFFVLCNQLMVSIFQVNLRMEKTVISDVVGRIVLFMLVMIFIQMRLSVEYFVLANVLANIILFITSYILSRDLIKFNLKFDFAYWKYILRESVPLGIIIVLGLIYFKIDTIMLSIMKDSEAVGIYGAPYKILEILVTIPPMFMGSVFPLVTKYLKDGDDRFKKSFLKSFDFMSLIILPIVFGTLILAKPIIILVLGEEFISSALVLRYLIFAVFLIFFSSVFNYFILASNLQKKLVPIYISSVLINIIGNIILIPSYSYIGCAMVTIFTEAFVCVSAYLIIYNNLKLLPRFNLFLKSLFASLIMSLVIYFLYDLNIILNIIIGGTIYTSIIYMTGGIKKEMIINFIK